MNSLLTDISNRLSRGESWEFISQYHGIPVETLKKVFKPK